MSSAAQRMRDMRGRRRAGGLREVRLLVLDARDPEVRRRIAEEIARRDPAAEEDAMRWIEAITEGDNWAGASNDETR